MKIEYTGPLPKKGSHLEMKRVDALSLLMALEVALGKGRTKRERRYVEAAHRVHHQDGEVEVDEHTARVSRGDAPGAYVQAWVWVYDTDLKK